MVLCKVSLLNVLNFEEHQASVPQHPGNIYVIWFYVRLVSLLFMEVCLYSKKKIQSTVSQHPGNNYGNLVCERFSHFFLLNFG